MANRVLEQVTPEIENAYDRDASLVERRLKRLGLNTSPEEQAGLQTRQRFGGECQAALARHARRRGSGRGRLVPQMRRDRRRYVEQGADGSWQALTG